MAKRGKYLIREFKDQRPVNLSERELLKKGQELAQVEADITEFYGEKEKVMKDLREREKALEEIRSKLAANIREKAELRDVEAQAWADPSTGLYWEMEVKTGEIYGKRPLTDEDRQAAFPLTDGPEAA